MPLKGIAMLCVTCPSVGSLLYTHRITMTTKRNYKHEYQLQKQRGDVEGFLERQKARRLYDKKGIDRAGKDIDHIKPIRKGGKTTVGNLRLRTKSKNKGDNK
jgi:hypothetical protein